MEEYICKCTTAKEWQKWLNQWKHNYKLNILSMDANEKQTTILLKRKRKV